MSTKLESCSESKPESWLLRESWAREDVVLRDNADEFGAAGRSLTLGTYSTSRRALMSGRCERAREDGRTTSAHLV